MKGWIEVNIGSIGDVVTGNTPLTSNRDFYGGPYPFIKPTDMEIDRRHVDSWEETYSELAFKKYKNAYIPTGATGVVTIGTVGEKLFQVNQPCFTNQSVNVVIPDKSRYDNDFVYYLMKYNLPQVSAANPGTASGRHHVSKSNFCAIKVRVPKDLSTQRRIASILSAYDDLIENNLKRIKLLEEIAQRTYEEWFVKFRVNGEQLTASDFQTMPLSKMIKEYMNGGWGKETNEGNYHVASYVIRGTDFPNLNSGSFNNIPLRFHTSSNFKPRQLITGDISIEMSNGNINNIGRTFFNDGSLEQILKTPIICASFCKLLRPINLEFGYLIDLHLKHIQQTGAMKVYKSQAANGINNFQFEELIEKESLIIPKGEYLKKFVDSISYTYNLGAILKNQIYKLKESRDILLPKLMNGTINV